MAEDCPKSISALMHVAVAMCGTGGAARKRPLPRRFTNHSTAKVLSARVRRAMSAMDKAARHALAPSPASAAEQES